MTISIIRKEIQVLLKEKGLFFWLFLLPILFILMFASIFGNAKDTFTITYFDADNSASSRQLMETVDSIKGFDIKPSAGLSRDEEIDKIKNGKATSLLVIPKGFEAAVQSGKQADLDLYRDATADTVVGPVLAVLQNVTGGFRDHKLQEILKAAGQSEAEIQSSMASPIKLNDVKENAAKSDAVTQYVPGYTVMFVFFIIITMTRNFIKDRDSGMLARLKSTPMKGRHYLIGMWVPNILVVVVQCVVLLAFGKIAYNLNLGDIPSIALIVLGLAICATGIGLALCVFVKSENQGTAFTQLITMGGAVVAGLWFPFDLMPDFAQAIGKFTPQYWAHHGFQNVMIRGGHIGDIWVSLAVLSAYGAAGILTAVLRFNRYVKSVTD